MRPLLLGASLIAASCGPWRDSHLDLKFRCAALGRNKETSERADVAAWNEKSPSYHVLNRVRFGYSSELNTCIYSEKRTDGTAEVYKILDLLTGEELWTYVFDSLIPSDVRRKASAESQFDQVTSRLLGPPEEPRFRPHSFEESGK
jgi:hypothetical protein